MEKRLGYNRVKGEENDSDIFDIRKAIHNLRSHWYYFIVGLALFLLIAFIYIACSDPVYQVNAEIMVEDQSSKGESSPLSQGGSSIFQDLGGVFNMTSTVENEEEILKARSLMYRVVKDLQLNVTYYLKEHIGIEEAFENTPYIVHLLTVPDSLKPFTLEWKEKGANEFSLFNSANESISTRKYGEEISYHGCKLYLERNKYVNTNNHSGNKYYFQIVSYDNATASYARQLVVSAPSEKASALALSITSKVPAKGEFVLNYFIQRYLRSSLEQRNQIADSTLNFINTRLAIVTDELGKVERQVALYKGNNKIISAETQSQLMANSYDANIKLSSEMDLQLSVIDNLKSYIQDEVNHTRIVPSNLVIQDPSFTELVGKYNTLMIERDRISLNYPETNPLLQNINLQLSNLRKDMLNNLSSTQANINASKAHLNASDRSLNGKIFSAPNIENGYFELAREQKIKEALYLFLVQKREEIAISRASNMAKATVIDDAKAIPDPVSPNKSILYLAAIILGLSLPAILLYTKNILNTKVLSREDILKRTAVPVLAELSRKAKDVILVTHKNDRSRLSEQFRTMRANLQNVLREKDQKVILLTSSMRKEGKSFISINLANVLALTGKKVLLIDMDLRKPKILQYLQLPESEGIIDYLISDGKIERMIRPSGIQDNLFIVGTGSATQNPAELFLDSKLENFIGYTRDHFDFIIIDAPPAGLVSDAQTLSKYADITLYVVRERLTFKSQLDIIEDMYENERLNNIYIILNDMKEQNGDEYGYNRASTKGYYESDEKNTNSLFKGIMIHKN